jgi:site-specific recombinase XerD
MNYNNKDFAGYLQSFFEEHLVKECNRSPNTIRSYRDTFIHLIKFMKDEKHIVPDRLSFDSFDRGIILHFLNWLESTRQSSSSTRNQRYQAIRSFFRYMMPEDPARLNKWQSICSIKVKVSVRNTVNYLTVEGLKCILEQIPTNTSDGRRNLTLLSLMYNLGARVQELISLTPSAIRMAKPYVVEVLGKGGKKRVVPLDDCMMKLLLSYMKENGLDRSGMDCHSLFYNCWGSKLTTPGVTYILSKYADKARLAHPELIPEKLSPHSLRHSRAVHMLQAGVELILIRDFLGHTSVTTTEIYARVDSKQRREALEKAYEDVGIKEPKQKRWEKNPKLIEMLKNLAK